MIVLDNVDTLGNDHKGKEGLARSVACESARLTFDQTRAHMVARRPFWPFELSWIAGHSMFQENETGHQDSQYIVQLRSISAVEFVRCPNSSPPVLGAVQAGIFFSEAAIYQLVSRRMCQIPVGQCLRISRSDICASIDQDLICQITLRRP